MLTAEIAVRLESITKRLERIANPELLRVEMLTERLLRACKALETLEPPPPWRRPGFRALRTKTSVPAIQGRVHKLVTVGGETYREYLSLEACEEERARLGDGFRCVPVECACRSEDECQCGH